jgi:hypothetical protein
MNGLCYGSIIRALYCAVTAVLSDEQRRDVNQILLDLAASPNFTETEARMLELMTVPWATKVPQELRAPSPPPPLRIIAGGVA